jgi:pyruvate formate lyase activating enzyme
VERVEVLAFHQMGRFKWHTLGIRYALEDTAPPTSEELRKTCEIFRARGLTVH